MLEEAMPGGRGAIVLRETGDAVFTSSCPIREEAHDAYAARLKRHAGDVAAELAIELEIRVREAAEDAVRASHEPAPADYGFIVSEI